MDVRLMRTRVLHCRHCGIDNTVKEDVVGKLCENCGQPVYSADFERELQQKPQAPTAMADRTGDLLRVTCPHCELRTNFQNWIWFTSSSATSTASRSRWRSPYSNTAIIKPLPTPQGHSNGLDHFRPDMSSGQDMREFRV
jgi:hypothetical protein